MKTVTLEIFAEEAEETAIADKIIEAVGYKGQAKVVDEKNYLEFSSVDPEDYRESILVEVRCGVHTFRINDQGALARAELDFHYNGFEKITKPVPYVEEVEFSVWVEEDGSLNREGEDFPDKGIYSSGHDLYFESSRLHILDDMEYKLKFKGDQLVSLNVKPR